jgi:hypothetical protein
MNPNDRLRAADRTLDERLRAAGNALREGSAVQVDAATGLREIAHGARSVADAQPLPPAGQPSALAAGDTPTLSPPPRLLLRASRRLALVVNLLLVIALSVVLVKVAVDRRAPVSTAPVTAITTPTTVPATVPAKARVPEACLDAAELADEVISRLNRNQRDSQLAIALRDYTIASQACRRAAVR